MCMELNKLMKLIVILWLFIWNIADSLFFSRFKIFFLKILLSYNLEQFGKCIFADFSKFKQLFSPYMIASRI